MYEATATKKQRNTNERYNFAICECCMCSVLALLLTVICTGFHLVLILFLQNALHCCCCNNALKHLEICVGVSTTAIFTLPKRWLGCRFFFLSSFAHSFCAVKSRSFLQQTLHQNTFNFKVNALELLPKCVIDSRNDKYRITRIIHT